MVWRKINKPSTKQRTPVSKQTNLGYYFYIVRSLQNPTSTPPPRGKNRDAEIGKWLRLLLFDLALCRVYSSFDLATQGGRYSLRKHLLRIHHRRSPLASSSPSFLIFHRQITSLLLKQPRRQRWGRSGKV